MRILIVDDALEICSAHEKLLRTMGHEAMAVQDPRIALTQAKRYRPDVILLDICMPGMDGWQLAEQLRADPEMKYIRIVAVTAMASRECERRSAAAGLDAHFNKPVRIEQWPAILRGKV